MDKNSSPPDCTFCGKKLSVSVLENIVKNGSTCNISECSECEIALTHPFPSEEELTRLYACGNYRTNKGTRFGPIIESLILLGRILKRRSINKYVKPGKILDIGCGRGLFLDVMRRGEWRTIGTELNGETASYAKKVYDLEILTGDIIQHQLPAEGLDAININQVLEHLHNPKEVLAECYRVLRKDGLLIISVPDLRSPQFTLGKENWFLLDLPFHLFHFTEEGLSKLLERSGFKIRQIKRFNLEYSPFGWLQTMLNVSGIRFNLLYDLLKSAELRGGEMESIKPVGIAATLLLLPIYFPMALILSVIEPLLWKRGGSIEIYATKK
ncbi:MAG: class I SAM-dependent methyltransferase [Nitrospinaceae bacterium]|nr:class I SAM-dependent methyltransferase [Nitrospinaceae bacterium]